MGVSNGQRANETTFNTAFMDRLGDTSTIGVVSLLNTNPESISTITNVQQFVKEMADADGYTGEGDTTRKTYSDTTIVANGDSRKIAIGKLSAAMKESGTPQVITSVVNGPTAETFKGKLTFVASSDSVAGDVITPHIDTVTKTVWFVYNLKIRAYLTVGNTLLDNQSSFQNFISVPKLTNIGAEFDLSIKRGTNAIMGKIRIMDNGDATARFTTDYDERGDCGITWNAAIVTISTVDYIMLQYKTTNTGTAGSAIIEINPYNIPA